MIHRIRMWLWERKHRELESDLRAASDALAQAAIDYGEHPNYTEFAIWECLYDERLRAERALANHESRRPKP